MQFATWVFRIAGIYGLVMLLPQFFLEKRIGQDQPPAITHPEYFYGFIGVAMAWQMAFLLIARDPARYRIIMLPATMEKFSFGIAAFSLYAQKRISSQVLAFGILDLILGAFFVAAFWRTSPTRVVGGEH